MRFLIHIGVNKTGSSSLQNALLYGREKLSERGILYPKTGLEYSAHHNLSRVLKGVPPENVGMKETWVGSLKAEFGAHELCILSSEDFATLHDLTRLTEIAPPDQTKVVVYLRDYAQHMVSWYQQALHSRNVTMTLEDFVMNFRGNFANKLKMWQDIYGVNNVVARLYDRKVLKNQDIVSDFFALLEPGLETLFEGVTHAKNPSLAGNLLFFKRVLNNFISRDESLEIASDMAGLAGLDDSFSGRLPISEDMVRRIRFANREDALAVKEMTGLDLRPTIVALDGPRCPDLDRLEQDMALIRAEVEGSDLSKLSGYIDRMVGLRELVS